jgi:hypothetical protein
MDRRRFAVKAAFRLVCQRVTLFRFCAKIGHFKVVADRVFTAIGIDALNGPTLRDSWPVTADLRLIETGTDLPSEIGERSALADQQDSKKNAEQ